ncbi:hypothetical protein [Sporolactobacillus sp. KGMB 08714]|uniref:hypothetical protein n=1 Tax=Sporolactobacillus sp. KGMB 08714 TaxID=3064704 RepID=UPI002FBD7CD5
MNVDIAAFKQQMKDEETKGLVIDLDETLSSTIQYWTSELVKSFGNPENLPAEEMTKRILAQDIPFWKPEEVQKWMIRALKSEEMTEAYPIIEGSDKAVDRINQAIPVVGYLTLRETLIRDATRRWLQKHGFPDRPVITRPDDLKSGGMKWKAETLAYLYPQVIGTIDDTPGFIDYLPSSYKGAIFLYGNRDYRKSNLDVILCSTWDDVCREVAARRAALQ